MARTARTACVVLPFLLSLATLILLILVFAGNTSTNAVVRPFYFVRVDATNFAVPGVPPQAADIFIKDWYTIGLWNYCSGHRSSDVATHCSKPEAFYWFNPLKVWHINGQMAKVVAPEWHSALDTYQTATKWLFIAYIAAIAATAATSLMSVFACCTRLGSVFTSLIALTSMFFSVAAAITATVIYLALKSFIAAKLGTYGMEATLGTGMFAIVWLAATTSVFAALFWACSCCCGSGARRDGDKRGSRSYERLPSPTPGQNQPHWWGYSAGYDKVPATEAVPLHDASYHTKTPSFQANDDSYHLNDNSYRMNEPYQLNETYRLSGSSYHLDDTPYHTGETHYQLTDNSYHPDDTLSYHQVDTSYHHRHTSSY